MRTAAAIVLTALLASPGVAAGPICLPFILGAACVAPIVAPDAVGGDAFLIYAPLLAPYEWRSAHAVAGPYGAGAAVRGAGSSTGGPFDVWLSVSTGGAQADAYNCLHYPPLIPSSCMTATQRARSLAPPVPNTPHVPLLP